jgi:hypothetical protein
MDAGLFRDLQNDRQVLGEIALTWKRRAACMEDVEWNCWPPGSVKQ